MMMMEVPAILKWNCGCFLVMGMITLFFQAASNFRMNLTLALSLFGTYCFVFTSTTYVPAIIKLFTEPRAKAHGQQPGVAAASTAQVAPLPIGMAP